MVVDPEILCATIQQFAEDENGTFRASEADRFGEDLRIATTKNPALGPLHRPWSLISTALWDMETAIFRSDWDFLQFTLGHLDSGLWYLFGAADIDMYFVRARAIFDYVAKFLGVLSGRRKNLPDSFRKLRERRESLVRTLDPDIWTLVDSADFFDQIRGVRDAIVHRGAESLVFHSTEKILFQVFEAARKKIPDPEFLHNENVVDFSRYSAYLMAQFYAYLNQIADAAYRQSGIPRHTSGVKRYHPALPIVRAWMRSLLEACSDSSSWAGDPSPGTRALGHAWSGNLDARMQSHGRP